jgi:hypothetical protein
MVKKTNTNSNFNIGTDLRNKQINEIIDSDRLYNNALFQLEKQEYINVYPDAGTQPNLDQLPPEIKYRFGVNASKFYAVLIYFTSEIESLAPGDAEDLNINSLKWSDLFESYGGFKSQINSFLKLPQSFNDNSLLLDFDKVVDAFDKFYTEVYDYNENYGDEFPLNKTYENNVLEILTFLENADSMVHQKFSVSQNNFEVDPLPNEDPDEDIDGIDPDDLDRKSVV